jgi:selenocysteine-specific elongation factor
VSGVTGEGLGDLIRVLDDLAGRAPKRTAYPATRMPIDRVFSLKGIGTVITGTLWSGELRPEDTVTILPPLGSDVLADVRVRSIQVHDQQVEAAEEGQRVALNLTGVDRDRLQRGQWVVRDPAVEPTYMADVSLKLLDDAPEPLTRVSRVRVDHGTQEILAKVVLADREELRPGDACYAQLRFEDLTVVYPGDHFILRSLTPVTTIGGGRVFDPHPHKHGTDPKWRERLSVLEDGPGDAILALLLEEAFPGGLLRRRLETTPYLWRFDADAAAKAVLRDGRALEGAQQRVFHGPSLLALEERIMTVLRARAEADPVDPYLSVGALRRDASGGQESPAFDAAVERLQEAGEVVRSEHGLRWAGAAGVLEGADAERADALVAHFEAAGVEAPSVTVAAAAVGLAGKDVLRLLQALERQGRMVKVGEDLYYAVGTLTQAMERIAAEMESRGMITLAEVRDLFGTSRRFAQALLEHMDSEGLTLRVGDARRLRKRRR